MSAPAGRLAVTKGHGTHNDFVLLDDRSGDLEVTADLVRGLCDRRGGVGADGLIRLAPSARVPDAAACLAEDAAAVWFMDYRNADGSLAQMCGNGVRVVAAFAERLGAWHGTGDLVLATRAGVRRVRHEPAPGGGRPWYAVDMGAWRLPGGPDAAAAGSDAEVTVRGLDVARPALRVDLGNPHTVLAVRTWAGGSAPAQWWVEVPGGLLRVRVAADRVELAGPAVLVAEAEVDLAALGAAGAGSDP